MSLRCSVLGHDFGESEVEREQDHEGSEVVVTVREFETCRRCGETRLISENTNVTAVEEPDDGDDGVSAAEPFSSDRGTPTTPAEEESTADAGAGEVGSTDESEVSADESEVSADESGVAAEAGASAGESGTGTDTGTDDGLTPPPETDAEILDGEDGEIDPAVAEAEGIDTEGDLDPEDLVSPGEGHEQTEDVSTTDGDATDDDAAAGEILDAGAEAGGGDRPVDDAGPDAGAAGDGELLDDEAGGDVAPDDAAHGDDGVDIVDAEAGDATGAADSEDDDPVTDDGVIMDEDEPDDRGHGEWPEAEANHPAEAGAETPDSVVGWPETEAEDEGYEAERAAEETEPDVEFGGGLAPEAAEDRESGPVEAGTDAADGVEEAEEGYDAEIIDAPETDDRGPAPDEVGSGITRADSAQVPDGSTPVDRPTEFHCPRCDHVVPATRSSLRAGDICPECGMGYLAERER